MKKWWALAVIALIGGCGPHYTIPNFESNEVEKVISSGRSPQACIENLKEDAKDLRLDVRLTDVQHQPSSGPISWIYANTYTCTGRVVGTKAHS